MIFAWLLLLVSPAVLAFDCAIAKPGNTKNLNVEVCTGKYVPEWRERFMAKFPEYNISRVKKEDLAEGALGRTLIEEKQAFLEELLASGNDQIDVLEMDYHWMQQQARTGNLLEFDFPPGDEILQSIPEVWVHRGPTGRPVSVPVNGGMEVMFYRKDIFDKYGIVEWPKTWEEFERVCRIVQEGERAARGEPNYYSFLLSTDDSTNRITYQLVMMLSSEGGGGIVEPDGTVSINNPGAIRAVRRWRDWLGDIVTPASLGMGTWHTLQAMKNGEVAVLLNWASRLGTFQQAMEENPGWDIRIAPIPNNGSAPAGGFSLAVNAHSKNAEAAVEYVLQMGRQARRRAMQRTDIPVTTLVDTDPEVRSAHCEVAPMSCQARAKNPDFFQRLSYRPAEGCGALYSDCASIVYRHMRMVFLGTVEPEVAVANMEHDLKVLLGYWEGARTSAATDSWTGTRTAVTVVGVVGGLLLVGFVIAVWMNMRRMPASRGVKVPVAGVLGLMVIVAMGVTLGVVISSNDSSSRAISRDLSAQVRTQALRSVQGLVENMVSFFLRSGRSQAAAQRAAMATTKGNLGRMELLPSSLVVMMDRKNGEVLVSSNKHLQPEGLPQDERGYHPWVAGALERLGGESGWRTATLQSTVSDLTVEVGGESIRVTIQEINTENESEKVRIGFRWLMLYCLPERVIMQRVDEELDRSMDLSIILTLVAVLVTMASTLLITRPLVLLAEDIEEVRRMRVEELPERHSVLAEMSALIAGFRYLEEAMQEYKAFIPKSVFVKTTWEEAEEDAATAHSAVSDSSCSNSTKTGHSSQVAAIACASPAVKIGRITAYNTAFALRVSVVNPGVLHAKDDLYPSFAALLTVVEGSTNKGVLHHLSAATPDELLITWNTGSYVPCAADKAYECAVQIANKAANCLPVSFALVSAPCRAGNVGTSTMRSFAVFGPLLHHTVQVGRLAKEISHFTGQPHILCEKEMRKRLQGKTCMRTMGIVGTPESPLTVYELLSQKVSESEWMYQLKEAEDADTLAPFFQAAAGMDVASLESSAKVLVADHSLCTAEKVAMHVFLLSRAREGVAVSLPFPTPVSAK